MRRRGQKRRITPARHTLVGLLAILLSLPSAAMSQAFPDVCKITFDERRAAGLLERADEAIDLSVLLRRAVSVEVRSSGRTQLVLHVYRMRGDRVVRRYVSPAFAAPANGRVALDDVLRPDEPGFGRYRFDRQGLVEASKLIPAGAAVDDPGRFVINGVIPFHPKGWEDRDAFYIVAVPADDSVRRRTEVGIGVVFAATSTSVR